jgi:sterol desaturase/sphingolipid hydroxylase (fatty acid hydroxylase superfamily)
MQSIAPSRSTLLGRIAYPAELLLGIVVYCALAHMGAPLVIAAYLSITISLVGILMLERWLPYRSTWQPNGRERAVDLFYLLAVQVGVPALLYLLVSPLAAVLHGGPWPHHWHILLQLGLLVLLADFGRYWLHRAAHTYRPLWRLQAVHHAPDKLYGLNVARFHPVEKALQYGLDALPFVCMGVSAEVLSLYFVCYAIHGFFQHANVDVRLGALNWLVSGPELHRFHHSQCRDEAAHNFGNNLIVWDVLFGTRYLPQAREVARLGLATPAANDGDASQTRERWLRGAVRAHFAWIRQTAWRALRRAARRPADEQWRVLQRILRQGKQTRFGVAHGFSAMQSVVEYRAQVPIQDYESLRPYIEQQAATRLPILTSEMPVAYARTSGTTGKPKLLPVLASTLKAGKQHQRLTVLAQRMARPRAYDGAILAILGSAEEGRGPDGIPFGAASGQLGQQIPRLLRHQFVVSPEVFDLQDHELKYRLIVRLALGRDDITAMGSANPSTFVHLATLLQEHRAQLLQDCLSETFAGFEDLPHAVQQAVRAKLGVPLARRERLRQVLAFDKPTIAACWPQLAVVTTWTGGSCSLAVEALRTGLPPTTMIAELGYLASELYGSVNVDPERNLCVPMLRDNFFEFVAREDWDKGRGGEAAIYGLEQLLLGREYYVIVTTRAGLYRYFMNDIVRVTGKWHAAPTLAFVQKGQGVTNITGEKLSEWQVLTAVQAVLPGASAPRFLLAIADSREQRYHVLIETGTVELARTADLAARIEAGLCASNLEYAQKLASGRLRNLTVHPMRAGTAAAYRQHCIAHGQRDSQFKMLVVQRSEDVHFDWRQYQAEEVGSCN